MTSNDRWTDERPEWPRMTFTTYFGNKIGVPKSTTIWILANFKIHLINISLIGRVASNDLGKLIEPWIHPIFDFLMTSQWPWMISFDKKILLITISHKIWVIWNEFRIFFIELWWKFWSLPVISRFALLGQVERHNYDSVGTIITS